MTDFLTPTMGLLGEPIALSFRYAHPLTQFAQAVYPNQCPVQTVRSPDMCRNRGGEKFHHDFPIPIDTIAPFLKGLTRE